MRVAVTSLARASTAAGALLLMAVAHAADVPVPALTARVTDQASLLSPDQRASLESKLADYEAKKGSQIAVLTVASTEPEAIEQYGIRVGEAWRIGRKGTADGVILIVAKDNPPALRRLRIEVGRGLEGAIPDAYAKRVIDEDVAPRFRQGDFYGGLVAGVDRIESLLQGEALPPPPEAPAPSGDRSDFGSGGAGLLFLFLFIVLPIVLRMLRSRSVGYAAGSRALNGSLGSFVTGAVLGSLTSGRGGGFGGGGFGGGGGGGGGGFSGGGGDFGGGGASGNW